MIDPSVLRRLALVVLLLTRHRHSWRRGLALLLPFAAVVRAGVAAVMTAAIVVPSVEPVNPGTFSRALLEGVLRQELGFDGVIVTDALDMAGASAVTGIPEAAVRALAAYGIKALLLTNAAGGVNGRKLQLFIRDDNANPGDAAPVRDLPPATEERQAVRYTREQSGRMGKRVSRAGKPRRIAKPKRVGKQIGHNHRPDVDNAEVKRVWDTGATLSQMAAVA